MDPYVSITVFSAKTVYFFPGALTLTLYRHFGQVA